MNTHTFFSKSKPYFDKLSFVQSILKSSFKPKKCKSTIKKDRGSNWTKPISQFSNKALNEEEYRLLLRNENEKLCLQLDFLKSKKLN
jgi:hypothetical protein